MRVRGETEESRARVSVREGSEGGKVPIIIILIKSDDYIKEIKVPACTVAPPASSLGVWSFAPSSAERGLCCLHPHTGTKSIASQ